MKPALLAILVLTAFAVGCTSTAPSGNVSNDQAVDLCKQSCQGALKAGQDLSKGPCLSNAIAPDWVCDVAHSPRTAVDDDPANQCPEFGKSANHFVEVDPGCNVIYVY